MSIESGTNSPGRLSRRNFLKASAAAGVGLATARWLPAAPHIAKKIRPNIFLLTCDQWHPDVFSHLGMHPVRTPNSDRIAALSTRFDKAYTAFPVCTPARCSWMTGRMPSEHKSKPSADMPDFGQWFSRHDYQTIHLGKWDVPGHNAQKSFHYAREGWTLGQYSDPTIAMLAASCLAGRDRSSPYLMHVSLMNPHDICQPSVLMSQEGKHPWASAEELPPLPPNFDKIPTESKTFINLIRNGWKRMNERSWTEDDWRQYAWLYYRYCEQVDAAIGIIVDALEASGDLENTLFIYTSDHGEAMGHHRCTTKGFLYDESVRVPFYLSHPGAGIAANQVNKRDLVSGIDLFPTFCAAAGIPSPRNLPGLDILKAQSSSTQIRKGLIAHANSNSRMVRTNRYKYIAYQDDPTLQLFDMDNDPWETKNLAQDSSHEKTIQHHQTLLKDFESRLIV